MLSVVVARSFWVLVWVAMLAAAGIPSVIGPAEGQLARSRGLLVPLGRVAEVLITCFAADDLARTAHEGGFAPGGTAAAAVLPYLIVPMVAAAVSRRRGELAALLGLAVATLGLLYVLDRPAHVWAFLAVSIEWVALAAIAALSALALQALLAERTERPTPPYAEATRLLTQLRTVARHLPGATLDPGGLAEHLIEDVRRAVRVDRAAVLCASGGPRLVVLAQIGPDRIDWETSLDSDAVIGEAWASQQPQTASRSQARSPGDGEVTSLVVPLVTGVRTVGLLTIEADAPAAYGSMAVAQVVALCAPAALRLEAALLFDEVRALATTEERQRLAREIHDGVAQELVTVGYGIDNALAVLPEGADDAAGELRGLRGEVTRIITELRLSLFELRTEIDRHGGLATAISEYARTVASSAGLRVHFSLDESTARLPAAVEAELLRIAQEAITNARRHAGAANLWVSCTVDPPYAQVEVSDDGQGIGDVRPEGRYGLAIMAERAERIRGRLEIRARQPSGTTVAIVIGTASRRTGPVGVPVTGSIPG